MYRIRAIVLPEGNGSCPVDVLDVMEETACNLHPCDDDCEASPWLEWSTCTESCDGGTKTRGRAVVLNGLDAAISDCSNTFETAPCNVFNCEKLDYAEAAEIATAPPSERPKTKTFEIFFVDLTHCRAAKPSRIKPSSSGVPVLKGEITF